jgi:hypothetical protein
MQNASPRKTLSDRGGSVWVFKLFRGQAAQAGENGSASSMGQRDDSVALSR